jgi:hypothetical protein
MKGGDYYPQLVSSNCWDTTMGILKVMLAFIIIIHSEPNWKIDVWKTGGLYSSPTSTSPGMTQPADNINLITTRHLSTTVVHINDVVHNAADMQTQSTVRDKKDQTNVSQQNPFVNKDIINDEKNSPAFSVSKQICIEMQLRSRNVVTNNGRHEGSQWHSAQSIYTVSSAQAPVIMTTNTQHSFRGGLLSSMKK